MTSFHLIVASKSKYVPENVNLTASEPFKRRVGGREHLAVGNGQQMPFEKVRENSRRLGLRPIHVPQPKFQTFKTGRNRPGEISNKENPRNVRAKHPQIPINRPCNIQIDRKEAFLGRNPAPRETRKRKRNVKTKKKYGPESRWLEKANRSQISERNNIRIGRHVSDGAENRR